MTIPEQIGAAFVPPRFVVAGVRLEPFSIGHYILLHRVGSPFVTGADVGLGDLLLASMICASSFEDGVESLNNPHCITLASQKWARRLSGGFWRRIRRTLWSRSLQDLRIVDISAEAKTFDAYLNAHGCGLNPSEWCAPITRMRKEHEPVDIGSPSPLMTLAALMDDLGFPFSEAVNMPLPMARWLCAVNSERKGFVTIVDRDERDADQAAADAFAREMEKTPHE